LHLELGNPWCDAHIDSNSITPGDEESDWGPYGATRFAGHGFRDLLPEKLGPLARYSPYLNKLKLDLTLHGRAPATGQREATYLDGGTAPDKENKATLSIVWTWR
jgi:hypothetical protein